MKKKELKKLANELAELELIHMNSSSKEEKERVEKRIMSITKKLMESSDGLTALLEVEVLTQEKINKKLNKQKEND